MTTKVIVEGNAAGTPVVVNQGTNPWVVSGTVTVSPVFDAGDNIAVGTTPRVALYGYDTGGNNWDRIIQVGGRLQVDVISAPATGGGPNDAGDGLAVTTVQRVANYVYSGTSNSWNRARDASDTTTSMAGTQRVLDGVVNSAGTYSPMASPANGGDGITGDAIASFAPYLTNALGVNLNRARESRADTAVATGIQAIGPMLWNGSSFDRAKEPTADGITVVGLPAAGLMGWNGTTWDRLKSTTANGLQVDVTRVSGTVAVTQSTSPWVVSLTSTTITGTVAVTQSTSPWVVSLTSTTITGTVAVTSSQTTPADALANTAGLPVVGQGEIFNGTNWDRIREITTADAVAVTGLQAIVGRIFNGTNYDNIREITTADAVGVAGLQAIAHRIFNGTNYDNVREITTADAVGVTGLQAIVPRIFNGTNYDNLREPTADGLTSAGVIASGGLVWNGSNWDRLNAIGTGSGKTGVPKTGQARLISYGANGRLTTRPLQLSHVFGAAGRFQYLTIFHGAASTKNVRIKYVMFQYLATSVAVQVSFDFSRLTAATTPATGNPAITPQAANAANTAEATVLALPTTQGTEANAASPFSGYGGSYGITGAVSVVAPPPATGPFVLWPLAGAFSLEMEDPVMRSGTAEGWAIVVDVNAACTLTGYCQIFFTEE